MNIQNRMVLAVELEFMLKPSGARVPGRNRANSMAAGLVIFIFRSEPSTTWDIVPRRRRVPPHLTQFTPSASAAQNASSKRFVENVAASAASTTSSAAHRSGHQRHILGKLAASLP